jgi:hypothetical protein
VKLLGGQERKGFGEVKALLGAKKGVRPGPGTVGFQLSLLEHKAKKAMVLLHVPLHVASFGRTLQIPCREIHAALA